MLAKIFVLLVEVHWTYNHVEECAAEAECGSVVAGSSWPWAYLQGGLEYDVPEFRNCKTRKAYAQNIYTTSEPLDA